MTRIFIAIIGLLLAASAGWAADNTGLQSSVSADIVGQSALHGPQTTQNRLDVREAEVVFYAPADHLFDGNVSLAAHAEGGIPNVELHEGYVGSHKLIPRSRFRVGQFFLGIGRLNQFHRHDWPFTTAPKVHKEFFGDEAILDTGAEYSYLTPLPFFLELTVGLTNGWTFGHDHTRGTAPKTPTNYARATTYLDLPWEGGAQIGLNYLGRQGREGIQRTMFGLDATAKWRDGAILKFLFQSEVWYRTLTPTGATGQEALGFYLYPQAHLGSDFFAGVRFDYYSALNLQDAFGGDVKSVELNFVPTLTYRPSEFALVRLSYNHRPEFQGTAPVQTAGYVELQSVFFLGAHPAHDF